MIWILQLIELAGIALLVKLFYTSRKDANMAWAEVVSLRTASDLLRATILEAKAEIMNCKTQEILKGKSENVIIPHIEFKQVDMEKKRGRPVGLKKKEK